MFVLTRNAFYESLVIICATKRKCCSCQAFTIFCLTHSYLVYLGLGPKIKNKSLKNYYYVRVLCLLIGAPKGEYF